jgi:hypothetical protein
MQSVVNVGYWGWRGNRSLKAGMSLLLLLPHPLIYERPKSFGRFPVSFGSADDWEAWILKSLVTFNGPSHPTDPSVNRMARKIHLSKTEPVESHRRPPGRRDCIFFSYLTL